MHDGERAFSVYAVVCVFFSFMVLLKLIKLRMCYFFLLIRGVELHEQILPSVFPSSLSFLFYAPMKHQSFVSAPGRYNDKRKTHIGQSQ